jgi:hypothetical protein
VFDCYYGHHLLLPGVAEVSGGSCVGVWVLKTQVELILGEKVINWKDIE